MRLLLVLILAGAGYLGYHYYVDHKEDVDQRIAALLHRESASGETSAPSDDSGSTAAAAPAPAPRGPTFESKIAGGSAATGEKAPPGVYYVVKRVSVLTNNGVKALAPGEKVKLLQKLADGRMNVTTGDADFEVKDSQVTNDLDLAREAEKQEFLARGGKL
jgi:hypothetical protein